jgi:hypothetical protein
MRPYESAGIEPDFRDLLADPVLQAVMRRDGIDEDTIRAVVRGAQIRLGLVQPCELVAEKIGWPGGRMPAISGGRDGGGQWSGAGRCHASGPLRLKCA